MVTFLRMLLISFVYFLVLTLMGIESNLFTMAIGIWVIFTVNQYWENRLKLKRKVKEQV